MIRQEAIHKGHYRGVVPFGPPEPDGSLESLGHVERKSPSQSINRSSSYRDIVTLGPPPTLSNIISAVVIPFTNSHKTRCLSSGNSHQLYPHSTVRFDLQKRRKNLVAGQLHFDASLEHIVREYRYDILFCHSPGRSDERYGTPLRSAHLAVKASKVLEGLKGLARIKKSPRTKAWKNKKVTDADMWLLDIETITIKNPPRNRRIKTVKGDLTLFSVLGPRFQSCDILRISGRTERNIQIASTTHSEDQPDRIFELTNRNSSCRLIFDIFETTGDSINRFNSLYKYPEAQIQLPARPQR